MDNQGQLAREARGKKLAKRLRIERDGDCFIVPSESGKGRYEVQKNGDAMCCSCPDFELRGYSQTQVHDGVVRSLTGFKCKHIFAVEFIVFSETSSAVSIEEDGRRTLTTVKKTTRITRVTYPQNWPAYNAAQTSEKALFQMLLCDLCKSVPEPMQTKGRPRLPMGDMVFCGVLKVYTLFSSRRCISDLNEACAKGYIQKAPHFNSISNYLELGELTPMLHHLITLSASPLKAVETAFAVDSSGFSTTRFVKWFNERYGHEQTNRDWIKVHLMCGVKTNVVTSVELSGRYEHDGPFLPPLLDATKRSFNVEEVSADKGYSTKANHRAVKAAGATPYIAFKSNAKASESGCEVWNQMWHFYNVNRDEFLDHYHKRSNVESTFSMIKAKFGESLKSKGDVSMQNELLCKILCHNICVLIHSLFNLGIEPNFGEPPTRQSE